LNDVFCKRFLPEFCPVFSTLSFFSVVANLTDWAPEPDFLQRIQDPQYRALAEVLHTRSSFIESGNFKGTVSRNGYLF
jgi:hypothetical protein